ncbi:MAG TPA: molybdopterin cofactor-binding domain-containing protein [Thermoguttaceae bacterium]|nr:molybdopterin cofactor-binding domain-containing protein [Thermoguttaceae bacterium]
MRTGWLTRRELLKATAAGTAGLLVSTLDLGRWTSSHAATMVPPGGWSGAPGQAHYRIDGLAKVTGQKIYARDFRPIDLPNWPAKYRHALVVCATFADHIFDGLDLDQLPKELQPSVTITAADLARDSIGIAEEDYPEGQYLLPSGTQPSYLGQAVAILLYDELAAYNGAKEQIVSNGKTIRVGKAVALPEPSSYTPETSIVHVVTRQGTQHFAQTIQGPVHPSEPGATNQEAMELVNMIGEKLKSTELDVYQQTYETPVIDPMFMEPESGLAWFDREAKTLRMLIGTQSPGYDVNSARALFAPNECPIEIDDVHLYAAYPGGGFGGRDTSILCLFLALAAAYSDRPIRIAHDRFQQFQSGVKRHASKIELAVGVDKTNLIEVVRNHTILDGGGRRNVSAFVADVTGILGTGVYRAPFADIWSRAQRTVSQVAGSMRGFGSFQSTFAVESMVDEIAVSRGLDPLEFRKINLLQPGDSIVTGAPRTPPGLGEICDKALAHPLWANRTADQQRLSTEDERYGVGASLAMKNFGSGADAVMAQVRIGSDGRVSVVTNNVDMGQGAATVHALATSKALGRNADAIDTGRTEIFRELKLVGSFEEQPNNPRWTPIVWNSTKATAGVGRWLHATEQATDILLKAAILPAARSIWGISVDQIDVANVSWRDGRLDSEGFEPIPFAALAARIYEQKLASSAMVHAFFSGRWIEADYAVGGVTSRWQIDALAIQRGDSPAYELIDRQNPKLFTTESMWEKDGQSFAAAGAITAVKVNRKTGAVRLVKGVHILAPGTVLQQDLLEGQMEGGWAMAVGHTLLEELPADADGAANGKWNLNRYHVALSADCAIHEVEKILIAPDPTDPSPRGIAELVMIPVPPAISNAVTHAIGHRFRSLPITPDKVRAVWS